MAQVIYGSEVSKDIRSELSEQIAALRASGRRMPKLAVILVGENPASLSYVTGKEKACTQVGMESELIKLPATTSQEELMAVVRRLNADPNVDGILCQLPLPDGLDSAQVIREIRPDKDVERRRLCAVYAAGMYGAASPDGNQSGRQTRSRPGPKQSGRRAGRAVVVKRERHRYDLPFQDRKSAAGVRGSRYPDRRGRPG